MFTIKTAFKGFSILFYLLFFYQLNKLPIAQTTLFILFFYGFFEANV